MPISDPEDYPGEEVMPGLATNLQAGFDSGSDEDQGGFASVRGTLQPDPNGTPPKGGPDPNATPRAHHSGDPLAPLRRQEKKQERRLAKSLGSLRAPSSKASSSIRGAGGGWCPQRGPNSSQPELSYQGSEAPKHGKTTQVFSCLWL